MDKKRSIVIDFKSYQNDHKEFECKCGQKHKSDNAYKCTDCQKYSCVYCELIIVNSIIRCPHCKSYIAHKD
jgi:DNA-directed RNA polymerase subunit RPC12/RpoP